VVTLVVKVVMDGRGSSCKVPVVFVKFELKLN
jgi:TusA-related sulfurtransferase